METAATPTETLAPACPLPPRRRGLTAAEKAELALIPAGLGVLALAVPAALAWEVRSGALIAYGAAALFLQGLVRDLARLALRKGPPPGRTRLGPCLCAESSIGLVALLAGLSLLLLGLDAAVVVGKAGLVGGLAAILALGFVAKDYVFTVKRVEDHAMIEV